MSEEDKNNDSKSNNDAEGSDPEMNQDDQIIGNFNKEDLMSNFYRNEWPEVNELVAVSNIPTTFSDQLHWPKNTIFHPFLHNSLFSELLY